MFVLSMYPELCCLTTRRFCVLVAFALCMQVGCVRCQPSGRVAPGEPSGGERDRERERERVRGEIACDPHSVDT